jgi:hypothetical protein
MERRDAPSKMEVRGRLGHCSLHDIGIGLTSCSSAQGSRSAGVAGRKARHRAVESGNATYRPKINQTQIGFHRGKEKFSVHVPKCIFFLIGKEEFSMQKEQVFPMKDEKTCGT